MQKPVLCKISNKLFCRICAYCAIFFLLVLSTGCVYFNTFYNARKHFENARSQQIRRIAAGADTVARVTDNERQLFKKSIEKCSKVLDVYAKDRKYVPLSILLLGEIYYWQTDYALAIRKFDEFISNNPDHKLLHRASFYKGLSNMQQGDYTLAEQELERVTRESPDKGLRNRARYMLAEISMKRGSTFGAIDQLKKLDGGGKAMRSLIRFKMGMLFFKQNEFENGYNELIQVENVLTDAEMDELGMPDNMKYTADYTAGLCLQNLGKNFDSKTHFEKMVKNNAYANRFGDIYNEIAYSDELGGETDAAEEIYNKVTREFDKTKAAARAYYRLGMIYEKKSDGLSQAFNYYRKAQTVAGECEEALLARSRFNNLRMIRFLTISRDSVLADSGFTKSDSMLVDSISRLSFSERHLRIAETYLYQISNTDSALNHYIIVTNTDSVADTSSTLTDAKIKALYAQAWILDNLINKKDDATNIYREIIEKFPATEAAKSASIALNLPDIHLTRNDSIFNNFTKAETLLYTTKDCSTAYTSFIAIRDKWPADTLWASKALLAAGWTAEDCLNDSVLAVKAYSLLDSLYGKTEQAAFARRKLKGRYESAFGEGISVSKPGSQSKSDIERKIDSIAPGAVIEEKADEDAWVVLDGISSVIGNLEGKRSDEAIRKLLKPAINSLDEIYINLVEEGLKQEGILSFTILVRSNGETSKFRADKSEVNDVILLREVESLLAGLTFDESPSDMTIRIRIKFTNNAKNEDTY